MTTGWVGSKYTLKNGKYVYIFDAKITKIIYHVSF